MSVENKSVVREMETAENSEKPSCSESNVSSTDLANSFKVATLKLVDRFLKYFKFEDFKEKYYPEIYKGDPEFLKDVYDQFLIQIKQTFIQDLDELSNDQKIFMKLRELDNLTKEAGEQLQAWRPSGNPKEDIRDHRYHYKLAHKKLLESLLENLRSQNEKLEKEVITEHDEIMALKAKIIHLDDQNKEDMDALGNVDLTMIENIEQMIDDS